MTEKETEENLIFEAIEDDCYVDLDEEIDFPEIAISYGSHDYNTKEGTKTYPTPVLTYGNFAIVQAQPKQGKSFFMSLLSSVMLSPTGRNKYAGKLTGHRRGGCILHYDTEQGKFHAARTFRRGLNMNDDFDVGCYKTYALRRYGYKTRLEFIDWQLKTLTAEGEKIDLVLVDGVADLCADVNDIISTRELTQKFMEWTDKYNCALVGVIHTNWNSNKATGHLGSFLQKKVESLITIKREDKNVKVICEMSRNRSFEDFDFAINKWGYPYVLGAEIETISF